MLEAIDLFCGCGGLALGAYGAGLVPVVSVDIDAKLSSSYTSNFPNANLINTDLLQLDPLALKARLVLTRLTAIIGGPPCQGFSVMGRRQADDPRNQLLRRYFEYVAALNPRFFFMENVPGLFDSANRILLDSALEILPQKYTIVGPIILDAADYGAATSRPRVIVIGYDPEELDAFGVEDLLAVKVGKRSTVKDAIEDLPEPKSTFKGNDWLGYLNLPVVSDYALSMRQLPREGLSSEKAIIKLRDGLVSGFQATNHSSEVVSRFNALLPGERDIISKYPKLSWDRPAHVLRAGTGRDKGSFQAARPIHPAQPRVITVREAARIQGFPDWFQFHETKWHSHRMIGNSVSPPFAKAILKVVTEKLGFRTIQHNVEKLSG